MHRPTPEQLSIYHMQLQRCLDKDPDCDMFRVRPPTASKTRSIRMCFAGSTEASYEVFKIYEKEFESTFEMALARGLVGYMEAQLVILCFKDIDDYLNWLEKSNQVSFLMYTQPANKHKDFMLCILNKKGIDRIPSVIESLKEIIGCDSISIGENTRDIYGAYAKTLSVRGRYFKQELYPDSFVLVPSGGVIIPGSENDAESSAMPRLEHGVVKFSNAADMVAVKLRQDELSAYININVSDELFGWESKYLAVCNPTPFLLMQTPVTSILDHLIRGQDSSYPIISITNNKLLDLGLDDFLLSGVQYFMGLIILINTLNNTSSVKAPTLSEWQFAAAAFGKSHSFQQSSFEYIRDINDNDPNGFGIYGLCAKNEMSAGGNMFVYAMYTNSMVFKTIDVSEEKASYIVARLCKHIPFDFI